MEVRVCGQCRLVRPGVTICPGCSGALTLADESLFLGEIFGKYRIESVLGAGGMGVVFRAIHTTLNRPAAVKIVLPQLADDNFVKRFLREAQLLAELKHPNIVEIYDFDLGPWEIPYFVMECLEGAPLRALLKAGGALPLELLAPILDGAGAGLAFAHRKGIVHRDLKPDNLFVALFDGVVVAKVLDFGSRIAAGADSGAVLISDEKFSGPPLLEMTVGGGEPP